MVNEFPVVFDCAGEQLLGIVHRGNSDVTVGVVIVVGGPQYRIGSHRQFVLMARQLAAVGVPVLRFDYRGMGDSSGRKRTFEEVDQDIRAAIDCFIDKLPNLKQVTLMGLCDAASAILMYGQRDTRVTGMVLMNPWVRTGVEFVKGRFRYHYFPRLLQKSFWKKVFSGEFSPIEFVKRHKKSMSREESSKTILLNEKRQPRELFVEKMLSGLEHFKSPILFLLSGRDLGNREFLEICNTDKRWTNAFHGAKIDARELDAADHTLSARKDLELATSHCLEWLNDTYGLCVD